MIWVKTVLGAIVAIVLVLALLFGIAVATGLMRLPLININREVTQHSQEYVEAKRSLLLSLIVDAQGAQTPEQRIAVVNRFCEEYSYVDFDVPTDVHSFAARECH